MRLPSLFFIFYLSLFITPCTYAIDFNRPLYEGQLSTPQTLGDKILGMAYALSESIAAISALPSSPLQTGTVYLYDKQNYWKLISELNSASHTDNFGSKLLLSNKQLIVSAERDDALGEDSGAVYIFERTSINDTTWHQAQKITAPDAQAHARFGTAINIQNNTLYIGAPRQGKQGKVYIFQLNQKGKWILNNTIEPTDPQAQKFGTAIAVNENTLAIGAPYTDANTNAESNSTNDTQKMRPRFVNTRLTTYDPGIEAGAIFVYQQTNNKGWQESARLGVQERYSYEHFGAQIALQNKRIVGSIKNRDVIDELGAGAVFIFRQQADTSWTEEARLIADKFDTRGQFGHSFALLDAFILVGAPRNHYNGYRSGASYLYTSNAQHKWILQNKLTNKDLKAHDEFGRSIFFSTNEILISSKNTVFIFKNTPVNIQQSTTLIRRPQYSATFFSDTNNLQLSNLNVQGIGIFSATLQLSQQHNKTILTVIQSKPLSSQNVSENHYSLASGLLTLPRVAVITPNTQPVFFNVKLQLNTDRPPLQFEITSIQPTTF